MCETGTRELCSWMHNATTGPRAADAYLCGSIGQDALVTVIGDIVARRGAPR
jgi:hypothetical protein